VRWKYGESVALLLEIYAGAALDRLDEEERN
jgi:hypothetical protein